MINIPYTNINVRWNILILILIENETRISLILIFYVNIIKISKLSIMTQHEIYIDL